MIIRLWKGYHSEELKILLKQTWINDDELLILCPPLMQDLSFVKFLPEGEITFVGKWESYPAVDSQRELQSYPDKAFLGIFTSGTISGEARLVLYSKNNIKHSLDAILSVFDQSQMTSIFGYPQPFHTFGLVLGYMLSIYKNIPLYLHEGKYGRATHERRLSITDPGVLTLGTPTHFYDLIHYLSGAEKKLASSYSCIVGGAPVSVDLWGDIQKKLNIKFPSIGYGCTEASPGITHLPPGHRPSEDGEIGFALQNLHSEVLANGIQISGPGLCLAMVENKKLVFPTSIVVRDAIEVRPDQRMIYCGRLDLMINRGGMKISLENIEQIIYRKTQISVICTSRKDERLGDELIILIRRSELSFDEAFAKINGLMEKEFAIRLKKSDFQEIGEFPINESSKIDRKNAVNLLLKTKHIPTSQLTEWMPHRSPMLWVDEVLSFSSEGGECAVHLKSDAHYMSKGYLRSTSLIEFMAQAYGFINVCVARQAKTGFEALRETFLVSITDAQFEDLAAYPNVKAGSKIYVRIGPARSLGPISMFGASIWTSDEKCIGRAQIKVFSN